MPSSEPLTPPQTQTSTLTSSMSWKYLSANNSNYSSNIQLPRLLSGNFDNNTNFNNLNNDN